MQALVHSGQRRRGHSERHDPGHRLHVDPSEYGRFSREGSLPLWESHLLNTTHTTQTTLQTNTTRDRQIDVYPHPHPHHHTTHTRLSILSNTKQTKPPPQSIHTLTKCSSTETLNTPTTPRSLRGQGRASHTLTWGSSCTRI